MHLNREELVDLAEGARPESAAPHLAACDACRAQLRDLRAMLSAAQEVDVPEPSPLFWDHLSARVSDAVAADAWLKPSRDVQSWGERLMAARGRRRRGTTTGWYAFATVAAAVLIAAALNSRVLAPAPALPPASMTVVAPAPGSTQAEAGPELLADVAPESDPSLTLVASLTDEVDLNTAREAGLAPRDSAEHAVTHMSDGELRELGRLLKEELARAGA